MDQPQYEPSILGVAALLGYTLEVCHKFTLMEKTATHDSFIVWVITINAPTEYQGNIQGVMRVLMTDAITPEVHQAIMSLPVAHGDQELSRESFDNFARVFLPIPIHPVKKGDVFAMGIYGDNTPEECGYTILCKIAHVHDDMPFDEAIELLKAEVIDKEKTLSPEQEVYTASPILPGHTRWN